MNKYQIKITGKNTSYFIRELIKRKINIYDLENNYKEAYIVIDTKDYAKIKEIKTSYKIEIVKRLGPVKYKYLIKKNYFFVIGFILAIFLNIFLSNIIFDVKVVHTNKDIVSLVRNDLAYYGLKKYHFVKNDKYIDSLVDKILHKEVSNIEWLEIQRKGTKYIVQVEQRKKNKPISACKMRNVVAKKAARILEIEATSGEVAVKINDYVEKGDVLISGLIHNKEDIVAKRCASGKVYGEVWYKVKMNFPVNYQEKIKMNEYTYGLEINIFSKHLNIFNKYKTFIKESHPLVLSSLLPVNINFTKYIKTKVIKKTYTLKDIDKEALSKASKTLLNRLPTKSKVISKKVLKKVRKGSRIEVEVFVKVKEDITAYQDISNLNIEQNKEEKE